MSKPRTASLRVAHQRACANLNRDSIDSLDGCTCKPSYFTFHRASDGRAVKSARVRNRQVADRALAKLLVALDEDRAGVGAPRRKPKTFDQWADEHLENLEKDKRDKGSTIRAYKTTLGYARPILGQLQLDDIGDTEIRAVLRKVRANDPADATVYKHLRHLRAVLTAAVEANAATTNPLTRKFITDLRLKRPNRVESYTDLELAKLWPKMDALEYEDVYVYVAKAAVATGARLGELIALDLDDLRLGERELHIHRHYDSVDGMTPPKNGQERTVFLIGGNGDGDGDQFRAEQINAVRLFEEWIALTGVQPGDSPIFPAPRGGGRLNAGYVRKLVLKARKEAGIPDEGEGGRKRRPFHALRGTYSRITKELGYESWLRQNNLGHASLAMTEGTYGHVGIDALREAAQKHEQSS